MSFLISGFFMDQFLPGPDTSYTGGNDTGNILSSVSLLLAMNFRRRHCNGD
jgi:hypothetical protein